MAVAQAVSAEDEIIARVGDTMPITAEELDNAVGVRVLGNFGSQDKIRAREAVLKELIKERLAEELVSDEVIAASPELTQALMEARRQVLLKYYLQKNVSIAPPDLESVKTFIAENPLYFENRKTYHFTEIIISLPKETGTTALIGKIQEAARVDNPTPESLRMLCDWLESMGIAYGYSKLWQSSEQMQPERLQILESLDRAERKVRLEKTGSEYRIVVLHSSAPDPLDPFRSRAGVAQMLGQQAWQKAADDILSEQMSKANIVLYGDTALDLDLPRRVSPSPAPGLPEAQWRVAMAASLAASISGFVALLYFLLELKPEMMSYERHFMLRRLWWSLPVRLLISLLLASLIVAPLPSLLTQDFEQAMIAPAVAGILLAIVMVLLFWLVPSLRSLRETRWLAPTFLALTQFALSVWLALART